MTRDSDNRPSKEAGVRNEPPGGDNAFLRVEWFQMLTRHCHADEKVVLGQTERDGARVIMPLIDRGNALDALSNYYSFSYGPIFEGTEDPNVRFALLRQLAHDLRLTHCRITLYPLPDECGRAEMVRSAFASAGWIALLTNQNSNHRLALQGRDFATYWRERPGALRSSVRRKLAKMRDYEFSIHHTISDEAWHDYENIYDASWKNPEPYPAMIRAIAQEAVSRWSLRLAFLRKEGTPVAAQLWTIEGDTACIHKLAHDSAHDKDSPGTLLSYYMFEHMIDREKVAHIDYGTGDNPYKRDWMEIERPMMRLDCFDPRRPAMWLPALKTCISQLVHRSTRR